ncbi:MAG TPA: DUF3833 domain-containing protein [Nitrospiraceae bacterium]|nr:DUF3833 domain-containing protein [Nitrospiraceae bacterium]
MSMLLVTGCASFDVSTYSSYRPIMLPEEFFNGPMTAHGVVKDWKGRVIRYFNADIKGSWNGEVITLDEDFIFDDGEKQKRVWKIMKQPDGTYRGTAGDVVGEAIGKISGNSMFLKYVLAVPYKNDTINITIDDRMYLVDPGILINESKMTKFGFTVGHILLVIKKI